MFFGNYFVCLLSLDFHFPRQILFSLLAQELGRALAEFPIVRQSIDRIPPQKIRLQGGLSRSWLAPDVSADATGRDHRRNGLSYSFMSDRMIRSAACSCVIVS